MTGNSYISTETYYYHGDHLGSVSLITDSVGAVVEELRYMPYGELLRDVHHGIYGERFTFTGQERDPESDWYHFDARYYSAGTFIYEQNNSDISWLPLMVGTDKSAFTPYGIGWLSVDPLADKTPDVSPYAYCNWNPIKYVDPDGRKLLYAQGSTQEFKNIFSSTVAFMNSNGTSWLLAAIESNTGIIYIKEYDGGSSYFSPSQMTIYWNPYGGIVTNNGVELSPATVLNHEADHALKKLINPKQYINDKKTHDVQYNNKEEERVITGSEQRTALRHGEIQLDEKTRNDHFGTPYQTKSPITNEPLYELEVIGKPNKPN